MDINEVADYLNSLTIQLPLNVRNQLKDGIELNDVAEVKDAVELKDGAEVKDAAEVKVNHADLYDANDTYARNVAAILASSKHFEPDYIDTLVKILKTGSIVEDFLPEDGKLYLNMKYDNDPLLATMKFNVIAHLMYIEEVVSFYIFFDQY